MCAVMWLCKGVVNGCGSVPLCCCCCCLVRRICFKPGSISGFCVWCTKQVVFWRKGVTKFGHFHFKYISHQQLIEPLLYICFKILCAVLIGNVVVLTITEIRPRDQTDAVEHVSHLTTNITGPQSSTNVLTRTKRQAARPLHEYCPGWSKGNYSDPCVDAIFSCYNYTETVCKTSHASCGRAVPKCGYAKCEPGDDKTVSINIRGQIDVIQTLNCRCASSCRS